MIHILQSHIEEEEEEDNIGNLRKMLPNDQSPFQLGEAPFHPAESLPTWEYGSPSVDPPQVMLKHMSQSQCTLSVSSVVLRVLGFLVDTATGNKVQILGPQLLHSLFKGNKNYQVVGKPVKTPLSKQ